ncbi:MAG: hypothetical protein MK052_03235 [Alphaproteobacteria bacterium]|nr:hypothetical protein [Alphaproteobacteria bacterium]
MDNALFLQHIKNGVQTEIGSNITEHIESQEDLDAYVQAIAENENITTIDLSRLKDDYDLEDFAAALANKPQLERLYLSNNTITEEVAGIMAENLRSSSSLEVAFFAQCELSPKAAISLAQALETCPNLRSVNFKHNNDMATPESINAIGHMMIEATRLDNLDLGNQGMTEEMIDPIITALPYCRNLVQLNMSLNFREDDIADKLCPVIANGLNHKLAMIQPADNALYENISSNQDEFRSIREQLEAKDFDPSSLHATELAEIYDKLPSLDYRNSKNSKLPSIRRFEKYIDSLPDVTENETITLADLTREGKDGHTPLSNPKTWRKLPQMLDKLEASGETIGLELLQQPNRNNFANLQTRNPEIETPPTHLQAALIAAPDFVIPALNAHGVQLNNDTLVNEDGKATPAFQTLIDNKQGDRLFSGTNWEDGNAALHQAAYRALPPEQQELVINYRQIQTNLSYTPPHKGR